MPWLSLRVEVERAGADALSDALLESGAQSVAIDGLDGTSITLNALFAQAADPARALAAAAVLSGVSTQSPPTVSRVSDEDWVRISQAQFHPLRIGERLWIGATWHEAPHGVPAVIRIDPGLAFGTGSHPTTRLMLSFIERVLRGGEGVLDYGCGSGILAIAAAKLGAARVHGVDIDPQAVEITRLNAHANAVALNAGLPEALAPGRYDVVVANILAQPLISLAHELTARTAPRGRIALAGVLDSQADEVTSAYSAGFDMAVSATEDAWVLLEGVRR
ncbi:MAG TPA: 50S ribosomal protein L11 methyltransferase [Burkholderiales bacterium]|nr:50S ribosomal protein L11 methyltransferase [Burkholderiales bacterium]